MAVGKPRDPNRELFWRRMVRRQSESGLSVRAWCARHDLREATFYWWRTALARRDAKPAIFVPVRVADDASGRDEALMEIVLVGGRRIRLSGGVDRAMLADVLAVVEERGC